MNKVCSFAVHPSMRPIITPLKRVLGASYARYPSLLYKSYLYLYKSLSSSRKSVTRDFLTNCTNAIYYEKRSRILYTDVVRFWCGKRHEVTFFHLITYVKPRLLAEQLTTLRLLWKTEYSTKVSWLNQLVFSHDKHIFCFKNAVMKVMKSDNWC